MRARWAVSLAAALAIVFTGAATAASATPPPPLADSYITDEVGVLTDQEAIDLSTRMTETYRKTGVDIFVVYVDTFTSPDDSEAWANQLANDNGLGPKQYLLAIAVDSRQYYLSADSSGPLSVPQVSQVEDAVKPQLTAGDWIGAATTAAGTVDQLLGTSGGGASPTGADGGGVITGILVVVVIALVILGIVWLVRRRRRPSVTAPAGPPQVSTADLAREASSALIATDDAIKTSEQELGFAKAQFGDAATTEFEQALARASQNLTQAFTLKQQLDDEVPDTEEQTRAWNEQIIQLCREANDGLDEKAEAFDELRKLEQNAPEALARVREARETAAAGIDGAAASLAALTARYSSDALATIADNPDQARERIAFADAQLAEAETDIGAGRGGEAAVGIRAAEEAVAQAVLLEQAVDKLGADLAAADAGIAPLLAELEADMATAATLPDADGRVAAAIASTRQRVDAARTASAGTDKRPLQTLESLQAANTEIDAVMQGVRDAAAQAERARQQVGQTILQAQAQVSAAEDYITARRGAVGAEARTRLAEAGASLVQAQQLQAVDPAQALQQAQRSAQLSAEAIQRAQDDVGAFGGGGGLGGMLGGGQGGGNSGGGMLGAVLGGIVINSMLGGGRSGVSGGLGGLGGSGGLGGMFGGGGGGRSSGGMRPGSFGGGGTRARRGGGRF
ncbi:TPM domain-containing protein [Microbacterium sp. 1P10UB]|uniref:TPM domain-containing protein n=1 Tax=unclassified Microbacterium TaxID=2609290 RepID=UPI00399FB595